MFKSISEAREYCRDNGIKMIDFKMIDIHGRWRHITIPAERLTETTMTAGIGFDGSNYGYAPVEKSDMVFIPDLASARPDPFAGEPTLSMGGNVFLLGEGEHRFFDQYPRNVARAALEYMKELGVADTMLIGPEFEFYVFDRAGFEVSPRRTFAEIDTRQAEWNGGENLNNGYVIPRQGGYHITLPHDVTFALRNKMCLLMEQWGVNVKYHHHEVGAPGQLEIEVELDDMLKLADDTMTIKYIVKNAAAQDGRTATFMPKPIYNEAGSGMHVHMLLFKDGKPLFYDENGYSGLSETAHFFMGGILAHARSLCGITNPSTNSYKRLVPGFEAPVTVGYATSNRSAVIRIPGYAKAPEVKRFELRNPDATCNPYFCYAAILMAGLDGIKNRIDPHAMGWGPFDFNIFDLPEQERKKLTALPYSLSEALDELEKDHDYLTAGGVFPEALLKKWISLKRREELELSQIPTPGEFVKYYDL